MHTDKEEALQHATKIIADTYDAMYSHLTRCGLSNQQIAVTFEFLVTITKTQSSMVEIFQQVQAEQIADIYRDLSQH